MKRNANLPQGRRSFLKRAVAAAGTAAAAPWFVPAGAMGQDGAVPPSNRVTLGHIGLGMMGRGHLAGMVQYPEVQILAACDPDQWRREDAKNTVERTYAAKRPSGTYRGCRAYTDLGELLARDDIDAVVISTGDNWHATAATLAATKASTSAATETAPPATGETAGTEFGPQFIAGQLAVVVLVELLQGGRGVLEF